MSTLSKQCRRKAKIEWLVSLMKDTKWRELCLAFSSFEKKPAWRTRDLLNGHKSDWDSDWFHHVGPDYCGIEWLDEVRLARCLHFHLAVLAVAGFGSGRL